MDVTARDALLEAIAKKATGADVEELGKLTTAYQQVVYGPLGGKMITDYNQNYDGSYEHHEHQHPHEVERGRATGFEAGFGR